MIYYVSLLLTLILAFPVRAQDRPIVSPSGRQAACEALLDMDTLTLTRAVLNPASVTVPEHCYVRGLIAGRITFHMQLPLPDNWNGRLVNLGDGGKDGNLDYGDYRVAQGYAIANSNTGHDIGAQPGSTFADDRQAQIDFGYRAVHLTANASKALVRAYYRQPPRYAYFEGCSTGGRQGLMEAQRFPADFDGIVSGAPVYDYQAVAVVNIFKAKLVFEDDFAGNLAFDADGDGRPESLTKWEILRNKVLEVCDANDGFADRIVDDPLSCAFNPAIHLAEHMCPADRDADDCFTQRQIDTIEKLYARPHDSKGVEFGRGLSLGSEWGWDYTTIAHEGNDLLPTNLRYAASHVNYLFFENSPGVPMADHTDLSVTPDKTVTPPEYAWWEFTMDDYTSGRGEFMMAITDATNPDLTRFLDREGGKLLLYHGWADPDRQAMPTVDYYESVVEHSFQGNLDAAQEKVRLFMIPGLGHCDGGPDIDRDNDFVPHGWDRLAAIRNWVENNQAPDHLVTEHYADGEVVGSRRVCPYPERAVYVGPEGGQTDRDNWLESNYSCR